MEKAKSNGARLGSLEWKEIQFDVWNNVYDVHGNLDLRTRTAEPYDILMTPRPVKRSFYIMVSRMSPALVNISKSGKNRTHM